MQTEPTDAEVGDGSALEKAFALIQAKEELLVKIEQLEGIAAQEQFATGRMRSESYTGSI